jgi:hypothetical protein
MRHAPSTLYLSHAVRRPAPAGAIEWEELPSLAGSLAKRLISRGSFGPGRGALGEPPQTTMPWDNTQPAELESVVASQPFREPVQGVAIREVLEPEVFRHFFGD